MSTKRPQEDAALVATGGGSLVERAQDIAHIARVCDADEALDPGDPRWLDLSPARGDRAAQKLQRRFEIKQPGKPLHMLFASHRGAGKSTELKLLQSQLARRYHGLYLVANVAMDPHQLDVEDLFLVIAQGVERYMESLGKPLPAELLDRVSNWFSQVIRTTSWGQDASVEAGGGLKADAGLPLFARLTASLSALFKVESKYREEVKNELRKFPGTLLESVNQLLDAAAGQLGPDHELLVLVDNLDRYPPAVVDSLLVRNGDRIRQLRCNLILTPPIGLLYKPETEQIDTYFPLCEVMNTVRLRRREQSYDEFDGPGRELMLKALALRFDLDKLLPDPRARDRLVIASGGAIRDLLALVVDAALNADGVCMTLGDVEYAVQRKKQRLRDMINVNGWWITLATVARDKQVYDAACLTLLYLRLVLKYNGEGWYDVLPLLTELPEFQHALKQLPPRP